MLSIWTSLEFCRSEELTNNTLTTELKRILSNTAIRYLFHTGVISPLKKDDKILKMTMARPLLVSFIKTGCIIREKRWLTHAQIHHFETVPNS